MERKVYTKKEVANLFKVHVNTLNIWEKGGQIEKPTRIGHRVYWTDEQINRMFKKP